MASRPIDTLIAEAEAHVHAGRSREAEQLLASVFARQPRNARAHYVMGLAALFARQPQPALSRFEEALRTDRVNPQYHFVAGMCHAALGRADEAITAYRRALQFRPQFFEALANLGNVYEGAQRFPEAAEAYRRALAVRPGEPLLLNGLGVAELAQGRFAEAAMALERALAARPDWDTALNNLATAVGKMGQGERAIGLLQRAVALRPAFVEAWWNLGEQLYIARRDADAISAFDRVLEIDPAHAEARYLRDAISGATPERAPDGFVAGFFDRFAADFDRRLTGDLEYRTPEALARLLEPWLDSRSGLRVADLGCGTGLSGVFVRPKAAFLAGVDLSPKMLEAARVRGLYDELECAEIAAWLESRPAGAFDLALAVDVFVYVGNLEPILRAAAAALASGGRFAFSVEHLDEGDAGYRLARSGRYAHARSYVERVGREAGLTLVESQPTVIRKEDGQPVVGDLYAFSK